MSIFLIFLLICASSFWEITSQLFTAYSSHLLPPSCMLQSILLWLETCFWGIPKRSVLEPLLLSIYVNNMLLQIQNASLLQFSDHICMICCGNDHTQVNDFLCSDLDSLTKWIATSKMQVNVEKSSVMWFSVKSSKSSRWKVLLYWMWVSKNTWESLLTVIWLRLTMLLMFARRWHIAYI